MQSKSNAKQKQRKAKAKQRQCKAKAIEAGTCYGLVCKSNANAMQRHFSVTKSEVSQPFSSEKKGTRSPDKIYNKNKDNIDPSKANWFEFIPYGTVPGRRAYHSTCIIGNKMYVYGGEDLREKIFSNMWVLNLDFIDRTFKPRKVD